MLCSAGLFETGGEEAGFEGVHAERGVLGEGNAFHGDAFMGVFDFIRKLTLKTKGCFSRNAVAISHPNRQRA
jgi:hypothetical protein